MAKKMKAKSHKKETQLTLPRVMSDIDTVTRKYYVFSTDHFEVRLGERAQEALKNKMEKTVKGKDNVERPKYTEFEKRMMKMDFIQKKMSPTQPDIPGEEWDGSRLALYRKVFLKAFEDDVKGEKEVSESGQGETEEETEEEPDEAVAG